MSSAVAVVSGEEKEQVDDDDKVFVWVPEGPDMLEMAASFDCGDPSHVSMLWRFLANG